MILLKTGDNLTWYLSAIRSSSVPSFTRIDALSTLASIESTISPFDHNQLFSGTLQITWSWTMAARSLKIWLTSPMSASSWATLRSLSCKYSRFCSSSSISCLGKACNWLYISDRQTILWRLGYALCRMAVVLQRNVPNFPYSTPLDKSSLRRLYGMMRRCAIKDSTKPLISSINVTESSSHNSYSSCNSFNNYHMTVRTDVPISPCWDIDITCVLFCPPSISIRFAAPPSPGDTLGESIDRAENFCKGHESQCDQQLTPWFLYFLIASFSFWAAERCALWKLSKAFVKSACSLSRCNFHCLTNTIIILLLMIDIINMIATIT